MEYVDGANLRQVLRDGKLTPEQALRIVPQICDALQYAHEEGIVHRDIKPENILLDRKGRVKIADFGLAKLLGRDTGNFTLTGSRQVMGTLYYMAPEQVERPTEVDHRADIYSLGVVFYEMLTGRLPVGRFPMPSEKAGTDAFLDGVVLRALERERERRYQLASDMRTDVEASASKPTILAQAPGLGERERVLQRLQWPANGLIAATLLAPLGWLLLPVLVGLQQYLNAHTYYRTFENDFWRWVKGNDGLPVFLTLFLLNLGVAAIVIAGARRMKRLQAYEFAVVSSLITLLDIATPTFPISVIVGGWALWVLRKPEVKVAFAEELRRQAHAVAARAGPSPSADQARATRPVAARLDHRTLIAGLAALLLGGGVMLLLNPASATWGYVITGLGAVAAIVQVAMRPPPPAKLS
jgi:hypothetical protein